MPFLPTELLGKDALAQFDATVQPVLTGVKQRINQGLEQSRVSQFDDWLGQQLAPIRETLKNRPTAPTVQPQPQPGSAPAAAPSGPFAIAYKAAQEAGIDPNTFVRQMQAENATGDVNAVSSAGAVGPAQFMPATSAGLGIANPRDPEQAYRGAAKLMADYLKQYGGDWNKALAAYNAGPSGNWQNPETQAYIGKVMAAKQPAPEAAAATSGYAEPIAGYSGELSTHHAGNTKGAVDLFADPGTPMQAMTGGLVQIAGPYGAAGQTVQILGDDGRTYHVEHLDNLAVKSGERVTAGQPIGQVATLERGGSAVGSAPHAHLAIFQDPRTFGLNDAATSNDVDVVGFVKGVYSGAKQAVTAFAPKIEAAPPEGRAALIDALLRTVAYHRVGDRPGRWEPRARKRRPKPGVRLMHPRATAKLPQNRSKYY